MKVSKNWDKKNESSYHGSVNHNFVRNKLQFLEKEVCANLDILLISDTKLDDSFPFAQFLLDGFSKPCRLDRCSNDGGIIFCIRDNIPSHVLLNSNKTESTFAEINFKKKKWLICASYNPHKVTSHTICTIWAKV